MSYPIQPILANTEALLKLRHDETLTSTTPQRFHDCLGQAVMMAISKNWTESKKRREGHRKAYYLSAEYLMGRLVYSNLFNMGILHSIRRAFAEKGVDLAELEDIEDAALGNGGLGRLAACFLDSAVTKGIPLSGYGLRYRFGLFKQSFDDAGNQKEMADDWTRYGDPWSYRREKHAVKVTFADQTVIAMPYDMPILGYHTDNIGTLRLWQCEPEQELDFDAFNARDLEKALQEKNSAEDITRVLYPNDETREGKLLRIRQQYVLSSASLQDILRVYRSTHGKDLVHLHEAAAIQLNDTHPALSIPELIRLLMAEGLDFDSAVTVAGKTFAYTNHTVMAEALETWDLDLMGEILPEIVEILRRLDDRCRKEHPGLSLIRDNRIHMADLSIYLSTAVNGVAKIHTEILKHHVFRDWYAVFPEKFQNKTNGITPRRWLGLSNPELTRLLEEYVSPGFLTQLDWLQVLKPVIDDELVSKFNQVKFTKKQQLVKVLRDKEGVVVDPHFVFDVHIKRLHEYKRQLLNGFSILDIYFALKEGRLPDFTPTLFLFGAKAAPGYRRAKAIIRYLNRVAKLVNGDPAVAGKMQVVFVQNYNCSYAEHIIPAADISEQISAAGTEASGTGNMKLMLSGAVTLGTLDGANVEIVEQAGAENNYIFGATVEELAALRDHYNPRALYEADPALRRVVDSLIDGTVETDDEFKELYDSLLTGVDWQRPDPYFLLQDFRAYQEARLKANRDYRDRMAFGRKCLMNVASAGKFSSDCTVRQYADEIWKV